MYLDFLPKGKGLIFLSMGSQIKMYSKKAKQVFETAASMMRLQEFSNFHMFVSLGGTSLNTLQSNIANKNISVFPWIPQKEVLKTASLAIVHGGMGTIKECIFYGVPMLITPLGRDQLDNAQRIAHHKLGSFSKPTELGTHLFSKKALEIISSPEITTEIKTMSNLFRKENESRKGVEFIKEFMAVKQI